MTIYPHDHRMWAVIGLSWRPGGQHLYRRGPTGLVVAGQKELRPPTPVCLGAPSSMRSRTRSKVDRCHSCLRRRLLRDLAERVGPRHARGAPVRRRASEAGLRGRDERCESNLRLWTIDLEASTRVSPEERRWPRASLAVLADQGRPSHAEDRSTHQAMLRPWRGRRPGERLRRYHEPGARRLRAHDFRRLLQCSPLVASRRGKQIANHDDSIIPAYAR